MTFKKVIFLTSIGALAVFLTACGSNDNTPTTNEGQSNLPPSDMSNYDIDGEHRFFDVGMDEALQLSNDEDFNGILLFAFYICPWCQEAIPVIHEASQTAGTDVFYVSRLPELRVGEWLDWDLEMAEWLNAQIEMRWIDEDEDGELDRPNIFVPHIVHVRNGIVIDEHQGTFEGHDLVGGVLPELTTEERATLLETYIRIFSGVNEPSVCPSAVADTDDEGCS